MAMGGLEGGGTHEGGAGRTKTPNNMAWLPHEIYELCFFSCFFPSKSFVKNI